MPLESFTNLPHLHVLHVLNFGFSQQVQAFSWLTQAAFLLKSRPQSALYLTIFTFSILLFIDRKALAHFGAVHRAGGRRLTGCLLPDFRPALWRWLPALSLHA